MHLTSIISLLYLVLSNFLACVCQSRSSWLFFMMLTVVTTTHLSAWNCYELCEGGADKAKHCGELWKRPGIFIAFQKVGK